MLYILNVAQIGTQFRFDIKLQRRDVYRQNCGLSNVYMF